MTPLSSQQTLERARSLLDSGRGAGLPELLKLIESLSLNVCEVTIPELAELIEKDAVVLAKVIAVANTLAHNPGIAPISTLSQAIHRLGYNRIRTIAVSLMLLESAGSANPAVQRDAAALALCAGLAAHGVAAELGTHDPEFAFACAALRNFGRIVMAAISPDHGREAARRALVSSDAEGYRALFGLTPIDLSRRLLTAARLPAEVLGTLRECEPAALKGVADTYDARLLGIADYGTRIASLALDTHENPEAFLKKTGRLAREFDPLLPGAAELLTPAIRHTDERLGSFSRCNGVRTLPTASLHRVRLRMRQLAPDEAASTPARASAPAPLAADGSTPPSPLLPPGGSLLAEAPISTLPLDTPVPWETSLANSSAFAAQPFADAPVDAETATLTLIRNLLDAEDCWLFRAKPGRAPLSLVGGMGPIWEHSRPATTTILGTERSVFGVALSRREVVAIHDSRERTILPYLPDWWRDLPETPQAFLLVPIEIEGEVPLLVLAGWLEARRLAISTDRVNAVRQMASANLHTSARVAV